MDIAKIPLPLGGGRICRERWQILSRFRVDEKERLKEQLKKIKP